MCIQVSLPEVSFGYRNPPTQFMGLIVESAISKSLSTWGKKISIKEVNKRMGDNFYPTKNNCVTYSINDDILTFMTKRKPQVDFATTSVF